MKNNTIHISEVLKEYIKTFKLNKKLSEVKAINAWSEIVGERISLRTLQIKIMNRRFYVKIQSSIIRQELYMIRAEIVKRLNKKAGEEIIDDIAFF